MVTELQDIVVQWKPGDSAGFVESFFLKGNDPDSGRAFWVKFTILSPKGGGETVGEVWAISFDDDHGHVALKNTYPISELRREGGVALGESRLSRGKTAGRLEGEGQTIEWDLRFQPEINTLWLLPYDWMYTAPLPKNKTVSPAVDTRFTGQLAVNGQKLEISEWPGMLGHNWGRAHAERYAWGHCNVFDDAEDAVFEGISAKIKLGPVVTPYLTGAHLSYRGRSYPFNDVKSLLRGRCRLGYTSWDFTARNGSRRLVGNFWTHSGRMVGLTYHNPSGPPTYCLNSKIADCELRLVEGSRTLLRLRSTAKAALEVAVKEPSHGVKIYVP